MGNRLDFRPRFDATLPVMIEERPNLSSPPRWEAPGDRWQRGPDRPLHRFLGGSPFAVLVRLVVVSLLVGVLLMWLNIRPFDVFGILSDLVARVWALGLDGLREFGSYIVAGAAIVLPLWLLGRVLSYRPPR